jgi:hypothetical protein
MKDSRNWCPERSALSVHLRVFRNEEFGTVARFLHEEVQSRHQPARIIHGAWRRSLKWFILLVALFQFSSGLEIARAQTWSWSIEDVDNSGSATSIVVDDDGNVHISYGGAQNTLKYGYRPAGRSSKWFTMSLGGTVTFTRIALDPQGNAHVCATFNRLRYGYFDGKLWTPIREIAADAAAIAYSCSVAIGNDNTPHLAWYKEKNEDGSYFLHIKYATLEDKLWVLHTVDSGPQTGKWNGLVLDPKGVPYLSYDEFVSGAMKVAHKEGDRWVPQVVEARTQNGDYNIGMGNSIAIDAEGHVMVAYYTTNSIRFSRQQGNTWSKPETVASVSSIGGWVNYRSSLVVDKAGYPHICYDDGGSVRHAFWDGKIWQNQLIVRSGPERDRYPSMTIDKSNILYIAYRDPLDGSLKVAVGRPLPSTPAPAPEKP